MVRRTNVLAAAVVCAAVTGVAGCGDDSGGDNGGGGGRQQKKDNGIADKPASKIAEEAVQATKSASSLKIDGDVTSAGTQVSLDLAMTEKGNCTGSFSPGGGTAKVRKKGETTYAKADSAFWKTVGEENPQAQGVERIVKNRWMKIPQQGSSAGAPGAELAGMCRTEALLGDLDADEVERYSKEQKTTVNGQSALLLKGKEDGGTTTVHVATEGKPYILKVTKKGGDDPSELTLSDYNKPVEVSAPPKGKTVDLEELARQGGRDGAFQQPHT